MLFWFLWGFGAWVGGGGGGGICGMLLHQQSQTCTQSTFFLSQTALSIGRNPNPHKTIYNDKHVFTYKLASLNIIY